MFPSSTGQQIAPKKEEELAPHWPGKPAMLIYVDKQTNGLQPPGLGDEMTLERNQIK